MEADGIWKPRRGEKRNEMEAELNKLFLEQVRGFTNNEAHKDADESMGTTNWKTRKRRKES